MFHFCLLKTFNGNFQFSPLIFLEVLQTDLALSSPVIISSEGGGVEDCGPDTRNAPDKHQPGPSHPSPLMVPVCCLAQLMDCWTSLSVNKDNNLLIAG